MTKVRITVGSHYGGSQYLYDMDAGKIVKDDQCNLQGCDVMWLNDVDVDSIDTLSTLLDSHIDNYRCNDDRCGCHCCYLDYDMEVING